MADKGGSTKDVMAGMQKQFGKTIGNFGGKLNNTGRLPTGAFPFDLATGGGLPSGRCSIVYGPESSGKTNLVLRTIALHQRMYPDKVCSLVDIETMDPDWARALGVDVDKLGWFRPSYAEQAVDIVENLLYADDCGIVAIDSLAAMITTTEAEKSAESGSMGGNSILIGKLVRKTTTALNEAEKAGRTPSLIYINQTRMKIGVMFGDPETMPGGNAPFFQTAMRVRLYGKNKTDPKVSKNMPVIKETTFVLKKWKVPIINPNGKFDMVMVPHDGLQPGETDDLNTVCAYLKEFGQMEKVKAGWEILGETYPTIDKFRARTYEDKDFGAEVRAAIIARVVAEGTLGTEPE